jgi:hypothetical protein
MGARQAWGTRDRYTSSRRYSVFVPVARCPNCGRGRAGYLDGEKELSDLTLDEVRTEIPKYEAKELRIRDYIQRVRNEMIAPQVYPDSTACAGCEQGWREFAQHLKDLEQLTMRGARSALGANTRFLNRLRDHQGILTNANRRFWQEGG